MVYKRYCSPFESSHRQQEPPPLPIPKECPPPPKERKNTLFGNIGMDDIIILGLILILLLDETDEKDFPLIIALGFLLITGWQ